VLGFGKRDRILSLSISHQRDRRSGEKLQTIASTRDFFACDRATSSKIGKKIGYPSAAFELLEGRVFRKLLS
jgi:hypothetical protein